MLFRLVLLFLCAGLSGWLMQKMKLPGLLGMLITGIIFGPYMLNFIAPGVLNASATLRQAALVIILIRAGLSLDIKELRQVGRPAVLMCFIPATVEIAATTVLAPLLFGITHLEAAMMGAVLAAVSPAVVVPKMIQLMESRYGSDKNIPQLIMAGTAINGVFVIVVFALLMGMGGNGTFEVAIADFVPVLVFFAVVVLNSTALKKHTTLSKHISKIFSKLWIPTEIMLFVLIGATVNLQHAMSESVAALTLIFAVLAVRSLGVLLSLLKTKLNKKERLFCCVAYMPKATVQAAIGAVPLAAGVAAGSSILTVAVWAILVTAPLGALGMNLLSKKTFEKSN